MIQIIILVYEFVYRFTMVSDTEVDQRISRISKNFTFEINPINVEEEKKKFFSLPGYEPKFVYIKPVSYRGLIKELETIETCSSTIGLILEQKQLEYIDLLEMLDCIGEPDFTQKSINCYGKPNAALVSLAHKLVAKNQEKLITEELSWELVLPKFTNMLKLLGLNWTIEIREMVPKAAVHHAKKKLYISNDLSVTRDQITRLLCHEIGTHILRAENGRLQEFCIFAEGFPGYLGTEEGLAVFNEKIYGLSMTNLLRTYAGRVLAIHHALTKSFSETFQILRKHFSLGEAWTLTLRAKRGLMDTSAPGACTKDYLYLEGFLKVREYIESGGDLYPLYYGKIGVEHAELMKQVQGLREPKLLPPHIPPRKKVRHMLLTQYFG